MPRSYRKKYTKRRGKTYSAKSKVNYFRAKANFFMKMAARNLSRKKKISKNKKVVFKGN